MKIRISNFGALISELKAYLLFTLNKKTMNQITQIECPSCGSSIDVQDVLAHQVEEKLKREFKEKLEKEREELGKTLHTPFRIKIDRLIKSRRLT